MDNNTILKQHEKMMQNAKNGTMKHGDNVYTFIFNRTFGYYEVTDQNGNFINNYNTKKITTVKKWLRGYLTINQ